MDLLIYVGFCFEDRSTIALWENEPSFVAFIEQAFSGLLDRQTGPEGVNIPQFFNLYQCNPETQNLSLGRFCNSY